MKRLFFLITTLLMVTGCLSHWFVESEVRLQIENKTPYTIVGVSVVSLDSTMQKNWIKDTIPPGKRSSVVAGEWLGTFNLGVSYIKEGENAVFVQIFEGEELNGGSSFGHISEKEGFWSFAQK